MVGNRVSVFSHGLLKDDYLFRARVGCYFGVVFVRYLISKVAKRQPGLRW